LLVEVEESLLKMWVTPYALARVWSRGEIEKHMCVLIRLASLGWAKRGEAWSGKAMCTGTRHAGEWSAEI
jgi:hypothetical protein